MIHSLSDGVLGDWRDRALLFEKNLTKTIIGHDRIIRLLTVAVFARGHVLLQGDVGVGKTTLLRAVARGLGGTYERIEGTVDLMPSDLVYYTYINEQGRPCVDPGPLVKHDDALSILFFSEINRARPQVHSLVLRVMAERGVVRVLNPRDKRVALLQPTSARRARSHPLILRSLAGFTESNGRLRPLRRLSIRPSKRPVLKAIQSSDLKKDLLGEKHQDLALEPKIYSGALTGLPVHSSAVTSGSG